MPYAALQEAAAEIHRRTGVDVTAAQLLRAGIAGEMPIVALFSGLMRNLTAHSNEDVLGLLVIPQRHLVEIDTEGEALILGAFSLDGKTAYSPQSKRTREHLQVIRRDLEAFIARIEKTRNEHAAAPLRAGSQALNRSP